MLSFTINNSYAFLFKLAGRQTLCWSRLKAIHFGWLVPGLFRLLLGPSGFERAFKRETFFIFPIMQNGPSSLLNNIKK